MSQSDASGLSDPVEPQSRPYGRRAFLLLTAGGLTSLAWAPFANRTLAPVTSAFSQIVGSLTPVGGWRIYTISGSMPIFDEGTWRLRIDGLVRRPRSFTYADLRALPLERQVSTFHCVTGWTVHDVRWAGVRFRDLLALVDPLPAAKAIRFVSMEEPYEDALTLEQALLPDVMLALDLDGKPLSRPHGSPARVVIPEMYGYKGVKWVTRMEVLDHEPTGYWERHGYDRDAWVGRSNGYGS